MSASFWQIRLPFRLPLFAKYLLVLIPLFLSLSWVGFAIFSQYDTRSQGEALAARMGSQTARVAAALSRLPDAAERRLAEDLLALLAFDRAVVCAEWRETRDQRLLATFPSVIGCKGQSTSQRLSVDVGEDFENRLEVYFTHDEVIRAAQVRERFLLLVLGLAFLMAVISASIGFRLIVGRRFGAASCGDVSR